MERGIRVMQALALAGVVWLGAGAPGHAQAPADPYQLDTLGFRLGMTPDEIKAVAAQAMPNPIFTPDQGTLSMGRFTSEQMVFGVKVSNDPRFATSPLNSMDFDQDAIGFVLDIKAPYKTFSITRVHRFSLEKAPSIDVTRQSLTEKYGTPTKIKLGYDLHKELFWVFKSSFNAEDPKNTPRNGECSRAEALYSAFTMIQSVTQTMGMSCGVWIHAEWDSFQADQDKVQTLTIKINDFRREYEVWQSASSILKQGATSADAKDKERAAGNKPKL